MGRFGTAAIWLPIVLAMVTIATCSRPASALFEKSVFSAGKSDCFSQYRKWQTKNSHWAAFAVNEWTSSGQACGWAFGLGSKRVAMAKAMADCTKRSKRARHGVHGTCYIYDIK